MRTKTEVDPQLFDRCIKEQRVSTNVDFSAVSPQLAHTPRCQTDPNKSRFSSRHPLMRPSVGQRENRVGSGLPPLPS